MIDNIRSNRARRGYSSKASEGELRSQLDKSGKDIGSLIELETGKYYDTLGKILGCMEINPFPVSTSSSNTTTDSTFDLKMNSSDL